MDGEDGQLCEVGGIGQSVVGQSKGQVTTGQQLSQGCAVGTLSHTPTKW